MGTRHIRGLAVAAVLAVVVCAPPGPTAEELLRKAADDALTWTSVRFSLAREGSPALLDPATRTTFTEATGQYAAPDRARALVKVQLGATVLNLEMLWLPEGVFLSNPLAGGFSRVPGDLAFDARAILKKEGLPVTIRDLKNATLVGKEQFGAGEAFHVRAEGDAARLKALVGTALAEGVHGVDVWIDASTGRALRVRTTDPGGTGGWRLDFADFNKPVEIRAP